ncbi:hypothetical protein BKA63DRAFT_468329 [Paraphoma chrysanthemicola]|nr:hypothetical protein BKA63DRAFT_468329 [Paraphoma chrysanthemicola]
MADMPVVNSHAAITAHNAASSPLLRLPAEIRNEIYAHVLTLPGGITAWNYDYIHEKVSMNMSSSIYELRKQPDYFAMLRTCHQIQSEAHLLPLTLNFLDFVSHKSVTDWVGATNPTQRAAVSRVRIFVALNGEDSRFCEVMVEAGYNRAKDVWPNLVRVDFEMASGSRESEKKFMAWWKMRRLKKSR